MVGPRDCDSSPRWALFNRREQRSSHSEKRSDCKYGCWKKEEQDLGLSSKGLFGQLFNYTVITSGLPQFIGNINLFQSRRLFVGLLGITSNVITSNKLDKVCVKT